MSVGVLVVDINPGSNVQGSDGWLADQEGSFSAQSPQTLAAQQTCSCM